MQNDQKFEAETQKALALSIEILPKEEKEILKFKKMRKMTDLEEFQEREKLYCNDLQRAIEISKKDSEFFSFNQKRKKESNDHFDTVFVPFISTYSISFEAFCVIIMRGYSGRCGSCAIYRDKRYQSTANYEEQQDAMFDFCPHLVCSEWSFIAKMRSISIVFWERFLQTRVGKHFLFCLPQCKNCYWTDLYDCGEAKKIHYAPPRLKLTMQICDKRKMQEYTPKCLCISKKAEQELKIWCKKIGISESRVCIKSCYCGNVY